MLLETAEVFVLTTWGHVCLFAVIGLPFVLFIEDLLIHLLRYHADMHKNCIPKWSFNNPESF